MRFDSDDTNQPTVAAAAIDPVTDPALDTATDSAAAQAPIVGVASTPTRYMSTGHMSTGHMSTGHMSTGHMFTNRIAKWLVAGIVVAMLIVLLWFGPQLWQLVRDEQALEAWVVSLGWWGPVALIALNALQIVIAPIPGYVLQVAAGFLFGPFWGGVWANLGLLIGSSLAFWLARFYGRPVAAWLVGEARLAQWEHLTHSTSLLLWFVLIISPIGDLPYFLAGLSRVSFIRIFVITLVVRVPSTFVVAAAGAGVMLLTWWQVAVVMVVLFALLFVFLRYQDEIVRWTDRWTDQRIRKRVRAHVPPHTDHHQPSDTK